MFFCGSFRNSYSSSGVEPWFEVKSLPALGPSPIFGLRGLEASRILGQGFLIGAMVPVVCIGIYLFCCCYKYIVSNIQVIFKRRDQHMSSGGIEVSVDKWLLFIMYSTAHMSNVKVVVR